MTPEAFPGVAVYQRSPAADDAVLLTMAYEKDTEPPAGTVSGLVAVAARS